MEGTLPSVDMVGSEDICTAPIKSRCKISSERRTRNYESMTIEVHAKALMVRQPDDLQAGRNTH